VICALDWILDGEEPVLQSLLVNAHALQQLGAFNAEARRHTANRFDRVD
jgi:hypothetical protein